MPKISKIFILIISQLLFLSFLFIILPSIFIKERPGIYQTSYTETLSLDTKNSFTQEFISNQNNLQSISVLLKNPALTNKSQVKIELQDQNKNTLRSLNTSGISIGDPSWIYFKFPYINSQKGDKFFIKISTDNQLSDHLFIYGNNKDKSINFKTTYTTKNIKDSFQETIIFQINQFQQRNISENIIYASLIIALNIFIFFSL